MPSLPLLPHKELSIQNKTGESDSGFSLPILAEPVVVSEHPRSSVRHSNSPPLASGPISIQSRGTPLPTQFQDLPANRLEIIRRQYASQGIPEQVGNLLLAGSRDSTRAAYQSAWVTWGNWCSEQDRNPLRNDLNNILLFLTEAHSKGKAYNTINIYRSMLSSTLDPIDGLQIGKHPLVLKLMRGIYNSNPPKPKYDCTWDVDMVVNHLNRLANEEMTIAPLARKLVTLIALASLLRVSEIASIARESLKINESGMSFSLLKPRKAQREGALKTLSIKRIRDPRIDPVSCTERYILLSEGFRNQANDKHLLIGSVKPHKPVAGSTVAGWLKRQLQEGGVDVSKFSAHSTRGAASSKAAAAGIPVQSILNTANWSSESTFTKFYRRDLNKEPSLAEVVLNLE